MRSINTGRASSCDDRRPKPLEIPRIHQGKECAVRRLTNNITLIVEPHESSSRKDFVLPLAGSAVTLDGRVRAKAFFKSGWWNADHHSGCIRRDTKSTCLQIYEGIMNGTLDRLLRNGKGPRLSIYVNDFDLDVVLSAWLLKNHELVRQGKLSPEMVKLIKFEDRVDRKGGALPIDPDSRIARLAAWANHPYEKARQERRLSNMAASDMADCLTEGFDRLDNIQEGKGKEIPLDTRYLDLKLGGRSWKMVQEVGYYARAKMARDGVRAFVSVSPQKDNRFRYSLWRIDPKVKFPLNELYELLNRAEGLPLHGRNSWGGSDDGGGSPRLNGSKLAPAVVSALINDYLDYRRGPGRLAGTPGDYLRRLEESKKAA